MIKSILRAFLYHIFALWFVSETFGAFQVKGDWQTLVFAGIILSLLMFFVRPLLKILFIPINILTFGFLSWMVNVVVLYLLTVFVPEIRIHAWMYPGFSWEGFTIPGFMISYVPALILSSVFISLITNLFHYASDT